jgi:threonine synthase
MPRLAVVQAAGSAPFYEYWRAAGKHAFEPVEHPETLATAIKIGDPVSWPKAMHEISSSNGVVEKVTEQEIADAKAWVGRAGIGCEPASAASLAGIRKLRVSNVIKAEDDVIGVLTGNVLKDPDYIYRYHTASLQAPDGSAITPNYANQPVLVPNDAEKIVRLLAQ